MLLTMRCLVVSSAQHACGSREWKRTARHVTNFRRLDIAEAMRIVSHTVVYSRPF